MNKIGLVLAALFLSGCASTASKDLHDERYRYTINSVESSSFVLSGILPEDVEYGEQVKRVGFSSFVAELDKSRGLVILETKTDYGENSMDVSLGFDYCYGVVFENSVFNCAKTIGNHKESLSYNYDSLPKEVVLGNGLRFGLEKIETGSTSPE